MIIGISGKIKSGKDTICNIIKYLTSYDKDEAIYKKLIETGTVPLYIRTNWENVKFADSLKEIVCLLIGCTRYDLEDHEFKDSKLGEEWTYYKVTDGDFSSCAYTLFTSESEAFEFMESDMYIFPTISKHIFTVRKLLQYIGTDLLRNQLHPNVWVNSLMLKYRPQHFKHYLKLKEGFEIHDIDRYPKWIISDVRFPGEAKAIKDRGGIIIRINRPNMFGAAIKSLNIEHSSETALDSYEFDEVVENDGTIEELVEKVKIILEKYKII